MNRDEYENKASRLIGNRITKVVYHEINYFDGEFHFFDDARFDSIDHGLELELGTSDRLSITWGAEFYQYGISLVDGSIFKVVSESRHLDASQTKRWRTVLDKAIESIEVFWSLCEEHGRPETRVYYPQALLLLFEGEQTRIISALEIRDDGFVMGKMDNITVFDGIHIAKYFNALYGT